MPIWPLAVLNASSLSLAVHVLEHTREDDRAEDREYAAGPGERLVERMVKELGRSGRGRRRPFTTTHRTGASTCGHASRSC
jgi:3-hydroxyacyl-CoA dehydrogenase/enoyl-CoA hydratase/3-hydroxybutyryl-CoA epimerase